ncbi:MAG: hypothetical protein ACON39_00265 [Coraliomargaritaceae bacterium]
MNETKPEKQKPSAPSETKPGFFQRIFTKLDQTMKQQADKQAQNSCCSGNDDKGGKCC